jgi:hypothetical protein
MHRFRIQTTSHVLASTSRSLLLGVALIAPGIALADGGAPSTPAPPAQAAGAQTSDAADPAPAFTIPTPVETEHKLPAGQPIEIHNPYGNVYIRFGGYEHKLAIRSMLQQPDGAARIAMAPGAKDGRFVFAPQLPRDVALAEGQRLDVAFYVPEGHPLQITTTFGDIESRGVRSYQSLTTGSGDIHLWARPDLTVDVRSDSGDIVAYLYGKAPPRSLQSLVTRTGSVSVVLPETYDADVMMSTSGRFTTDFSLSVAYADGSEPDKKAHVSIGRVPEGTDRASLVLESLRGDIAISRMAVFVQAGESGGSDEQTAP